MTIEPTEDEIEELFQAVIAVLTNKPANLIANVLSNLVAATSMEIQSDPYTAARLIYKNAKEHIKRNLDSQGIHTKRPKGTRPN